MDNHYHLLIETPEANLSYGMWQLNGISNSIVICDDNLDLKCEGSIWFR
jgi:REP element-mobilizing transposase RayT